MLKLCNQCGYMKDYCKKEILCPVCKINSLVDITNSIEEAVRIFRLPEEEQEQFKIDYLGHDFEPELKQKRIEFDIRRSQILRERSAKIEINPKITCPYCQSTDTKKISGTSRFMSTGIFGLASGKIGKQWHCNKCKSDF